MSMIYAVASGKGGTGKSTVSCGLAISFASKGQRVLLIDLDAGLRCLDSYFGIDEGVVYDLSDAFENADLEDVSYTVPYESNISIIASPPDRKKIDSFEFSKFIKKCRNEFDVIILDLPAGLDFSVISEISEKITCLCVANQNPVSVKDADIVRNKIGCKKSYLIINKFEPDLILKQKHQNIDSMVDVSGMQLIGIIPETLELKIFPVTSKIKKRGRTIKALNRITGRLSGESIRLPRPENI